MLLSDVSGIINRHVGKDRTYFFSDGVGSWKKEKLRKDGTYELMIGKFSLAFPRRKPMARKKEEFLFYAEGEDEKGTIKTFSVYKAGTAYFIVQHDPHYTHLCHPVVKKAEDVKGEISIVFNVKNIKIKPRLR